MGTDLEALIYFQLHTHKIPSDFKDDFARHTKMVSSILRITTAITEDLGRTQNKGVLKKTHIWPLVCSNNNNDVIMFSRVHVS